jgi:dihydroorotase
VPPDEVGVRTGVTTVVDGGSTGYAKFEGFKRFIIPEAYTDIFAFIHVTPNGLSKTPETWGWYDINPDAVLQTIEANRDIIKGIKMRAIGSVIENQGIDAIKIAKRIASAAKLPLSVHIGIWLDETTPEKQVDAFTIELLNSLDKGDIIEHIYTANPGGVIKPDGTVFPELWDAIKRGVILDVANGIFNFSFNIARIGLEKGVLPTALSTDFVTPNFDTPMVLSLTVTMSKFLALGLSLDQVIEMTTINPARALGEEHQRGSLSVGMKADISILELQEGHFIFQDRIEKDSAIKGNLLLVPKLTIKDGNLIEAWPRHIEYVYDK